MTTKQSRFRIITAAFICFTLTTGAIGPSLAESKNYEAAVLLAASAKKISKSQQEKITELMKWLEIPHEELITLEAGVINELHRKAKNGNKSSGTAKLNKKAIKQKTLEKVAPVLIEYAGSKMPKTLVDIYKGTALAETAQSTAESLNKILVEGTITGTGVETALRDVFSTAVTDTTNFASGIFTKYSLANVATEIIKDPKNGKAIAAAVEKEIKNYAEQELNKLANQALATIFPIFEGVQIDFTNLSRDTLKSTIRSAIVNALAQSYLGPQYVAIYLAVSTLCPPCMAKLHDELRRFDKKYLRPVTDKAEAEWSRFENKVKAESERVKKQIDAEWNRLKDRVNAEADRVKKDINAEANRTKEKFNAELERAKVSRAGKEIERQLDDIKEEAERVVDTAGAELEREYKDVIAEATRFNKRIGKEIERAANQQLEIVKKLGNSTKNELKREAKQVSSAAQSAKEKVEAELKRVADKVKNEANRVKKKLKKLRKKF